MSHGRRQAMRAARQKGRDQVLKMIGKAAAYNEQTAPSAKPGAGKNTTKKPKTPFDVLRSYLKARAELRWAVAFALIVAVVLWLLGVEEMAHCALALAVESVVTHIGLRLIGFE